MVERDVPMQTENRGHKGHTGCTRSNAYGSLDDARCQSLDPGIAPKHH